MASSSAALFAKRCQNFASGLTEARRTGVSKGALLVTNAVAAELGGRSIKLRGMRGAKVSVGYDLKGSVNPVAMVRMRGPAHIIERPTKAHRIPRDRNTATGRRSKGRQKRLKLPSGGIRRSVMHPGTAGKYPWRKGLGKAVPHVTSTVAAEVRRAMFRAFRGA